MVNTTKWREAYTEGRESFFYSDEITHYKCLKKMSILDLPKTSVILDVGCGNGDLLRFLSKMGYTNVIGVEPDSDLFIGGPVLKGKASDIPFSNLHFDAIICMSSLHHVETTEELKKSFKEIHRVLKRGGILAYCEPSDTFMRKILMKLIMSPLGNLTKFSREKRKQVSEEIDTLNWWLEIERQIPDMLEGFEIIKIKREALKTYLVARKI
jgi:ubiquinone/menaquinone biosynthesis C-methylase UbiE